MQTRTRLRPQKKKFIFHCQGTIPPTDMPRVAKKIIDFVGMNSARRGRIDKYPYRGGGDKGATGFFPLMESYLIIDTYDEQNETEILLSTCKPERVIESALISLLAKEIGPVIKGGDHV